VHNPEVHISFCSACFSLNSSREIKSPASISFIPFLILFSVSSSIYIDTSVISALFDDSTPARKILTEEFWGRIHNYDVYLSQMAEGEIAGVTSKDLIKKMIQLFIWIWSIPMMLTVTSLNWQMAGEIQILAGIQIQNPTVTTD
jgi:hypothetical protein